MVCAVDFGTGNIVGVRLNLGGNVEFNLDRDVFVELPSEADEAKSFLDQAGAKLLTIDGRNYVVGKEAVNFATFFGIELSRPMKQGMINTDADEVSLAVLMEIVAGVLGEPKEQNELCYACIPAEPIDTQKNVVYHKKTIELILTKLGYNPKIINEAQAAIYSELKESNFTGIGCSLGAGMSNLAISYRGLPVFSFSVARGGDWIDEMTRQATNKTAAEITMIKETDLDLTKEGDSQILRYLKMYYEEHIDYVISNIIKKFNQTTRIPPTIDARNKNAETLPFVLCGGTSLPKGFSELFRDRVENTKGFPFKISKIIVPKEPLYTVANGLLIKALSEK